MSLTASCELYFKGIGVVELRVLAILRLCITAVGELVGFALSVFGLFISL